VSLLLSLASVYCLPLVRYGIFLVRSDRSEMQSVALLAFTKLTGLI
jgi:hypothetical protein